MTSIVCRSLCAVAAAAGVALSLVPATGQAQYQWRDASGRMVFSDRPPPPSVPAGRILRAPAQPEARSAAQSPAHAAPQSADAGAAGAAAGRDLAARDAGASDAPGASGGRGAKDAMGANAEAPKPRWVEQAEAYRKRRSERAEAEQTRQREREHAAELASRCSDMRASLRLLESSTMRVGRIDDQGRQVQLSSAERARRAADFRNAIATQCKG